MRRIQTSALFDRQLFDFAESYRDIAGLETADRFLACIDDALAFIADAPEACSVCHEFREIAELRDYTFRKWRVKVFPFSIFFRILEDSLIRVEAIYPHKMDILNRLPSDRDLNG